MEIEVCDVIAEVIKVRPGMVKPDDTLNEWGVDSESAEELDIILELEERFNVEMTEEAFSRCHNVKQIIELVKSLRESANSTAVTAK